MGIASVTSGATQIQQNGKINACSYMTDVVGAGSRTALTTLSKQTALAVGGGAMSDFSCQGKSVKETLQGIPGNAYGTAAGYGVGTTGVGSVGQALTTEAVKDVTSKTLPK